MITPSVWIVTAVVGFRVVIAAMVPPSTRTQPFRTPSGVIT